MIDISKIEKLFSDRLKEYSEIYKVNYRATLVKIHYVENQGIVFGLFVENQFKANLDLQEDIFKIKMDMTGDVEQVKGFLAILLNMFCNELECNATDVSVIVQTQSDTDASPVLALGKNGNFVRWIDLSEFK